MVRNILCLAIFAFTTSAFAEDKKPALSGSWTKAGDQVTLTFKFEKEGELTLIAKHDDNVLTMKCKYTIEKDVVKAKLSSTEVKGEFPFKPDNKFTFQFKLKVDGDKAKVSDYDSNMSPDSEKNVVEGEYKKDAK